MPPPDRALIERVAGALATREGLVEKDWHVVQAIAVIGSVDHGDMQLAFSGGTSLSKGWSTIKRFSEDIDFKVREPPAESKAAGEKNRRVYRHKILKALTDSGLILVGEATVRNAGKFFSADFQYKAVFKAAEGLRSHLKVDMTFIAPAREPVSRQIQSLVGQYEKTTPETTIFCIDLIETAADKISALAWRVITRNRTDPNDDPAVIRHLHDLAAVEKSLDVNAFTALALEIIGLDTKRAKPADGMPADPGERLDLMLKKLRSDPEWEREYGEFVTGVSYAPAAEQIDFKTALAACERLVGHIKRANRSS